MNTLRRCYLHLIASVFILTLCPAGYAAVSIVDNFDQGGFFITPASGTFQESVDLPLGSRRGAQLSTSGLWPDAVMSSSLNPGTGKLSFYSSGTSTFFPLSLTLVYGGPTLHDIAGCTEFILGFSELSGVGTLYIELGASNGVEGVVRVNLTGPGDVQYYVSDVYAGAAHTLDSFNVLHFRFESRSPQFSFTLDEIRLVPEPSGALLTVAVGAGFLALRRRRGWGT